MPPVQKIISAPAAFYLVDSRHDIVCIIRYDFMGYFIHTKLCTTFLNDWGESIFNTAFKYFEPVVTMPIVLRTNGFTLSKGLPLAIFFASSTCCSSNNNGIQRMPANLSPTFTGVLLNLVTIVSSPMLLIACADLHQL